MRNAVAQQLEKSWDDLNEQSLRGLKVTGMNDIADAIEEIDRLQEIIDKNRRSTGGDSPPVSLF